MKLAKAACWLLLLLCRAYAQKPVVITYAGGYRGNIINTQKIRAGKLTHLLYAFADVKNGRAYLHYPVTDKINLENLVRLKQQNAGLKVLLSVGGIGWSNGFSTLALTEAGRNAFAQSCVALVTRFKLDGIDIDWEFPGYPGEGGNPYRAADKENYTLLFKALRTAFNSLAQQTGKHYLLTAAVDGWAPHFLPHTQMDQVQQYADYICLMAYNFNDNVHHVAGGHYLYAPEGWDAAGSTDGAVTAFLQAGVPAAKLVAGSGFFPAAFRMQSSDPHQGRFTARLPFSGGLARVYRMAGHNGYKKYTGDDGAPYLFNAATKTRIAYEDSSIVAAKCSYIMSHKLAGIMYWDYFSDPHGVLLNVIAERLR